MMYIQEPYDDNKNLGGAYNLAMQHYGPEDWVCLKDYDTLFLLPETIKYINHYTQVFPDAGILTCYTNRIGNKDQMVFGKTSENDSIRYHIGVAKQMVKNLFKATELQNPISGMLMVIKKSTWDNVKFDHGCLGVDNNYHRRIQATGMKILRMDGVYIWHTYRLTTGIKNVQHLL